MKNSIDIISDSNTKFISNQFSNFFNTKKIKYKFYSINNANNINLSILKNFKKKSQNCLIISDLNKSFEDFCNLSNRFDLDEINFKKKIINYIKNITNLNTQYENIFLFLFPETINNQYFISFKYYNKDPSYYIRFCNLIIQDYVLKSNYNNIILIDPNPIDKKIKLRINDLNLNNYFNISFSYDYYKYLANLFYETINNIKTNINIKLIITDLDNTLIGGEVGETLYKNIKANNDSPEGKFFFAIQERLLLLKKSGILLALCSKNEEINVKNFFKFKKDMPLKLSDFIIKKINWENKVDNIKSILKELNLKQDNTLFIDDSSHERSLISKMFPKMKIFGFSKNLKNYVEEFLNLNFIKLKKISNIDKIRSSLYLANYKRKKSFTKSKNEIDWLNHLQIKLKIQRINNFKRAEEMFLRFNQFHTSLQRLTEKKIINLSKSTNYYCYQIEHMDKFSNDEIISLLIFKMNKNNIYVENFLLSCRHFEKYLEDYILYYCLYVFVKKDFNIYINVKKSNLNKYVNKLFSKKDYLLKKKDKYKIDLSTLQKNIKKIKINVKK